MKLHANVCSQWEWTKLRQLLVIVLLGLGIVSTYGQTKTVSGIVKSESGGEPLVGATVKVKETNTGGITDIDGRYTIQANLGQTLIVSYIGYRTKEVKVERTTRIDILLQEDNEMLDEVVVVGYGTMKRSDLTGSVVSVTGDELKKSVVTSLDQALQGRAAGVQVTQNSGTPGGGISVSIRGINSLNGNEPLYVIDGVAISGNNTSNSSVLSSINPADIVSMEVLKDASATAIYGSRASNGVVLITTRQGEEGKTKVSYEGYYALQQLPKKLETLELAADVINNSGISLYENYEDLFKYKHNNNPESLIAMQWVPLGDWGVCNTLLADLAGNSKMTGGVNVWSSYQASIDMLQQYELGDTIRRNATFCTPGTYYSYICIADGGYTYDGATSCIKKGVPGGPDDDNDGYIQSMNSPLNTYILRLADVYLTYAEACLGNSEELAGGPGLEALNQVRDRARIPRKERVTFEDIIRERRVEFSMEYCNWYDMVSWYHWKPDYMLNYFQNQHRGYTVDLIVKDEDGYLHFGKKEGDTFLEGIENWQEPGENIEIHHGNILMPYPESDVIQNPLLNEEPVAYEFSE